MASMRRKGGNALTITVVTIGIIVLLIAFFALNYGQLFGTHLEARTAIETAALQAATDLRRIVLSPADGTNFGFISLVDQPPAKNDPDNRPVLGINTIMATVRLDAIIAGKLGNSSMLVLAIDDLQRAKRDAAMLNARIESAISDGAIVKDKEGNEVNIRANVQQAYDTNSRRMGKGRRVGPVRITYGTVAGSFSTSTPVPTPLSAAQVDDSTSFTLGNQRFYKAGVPVTTRVLGQNLVFQFMPLAKECALIERTRFTPEIADGTCGTAVLVEADEEATQFAPNSPAGSLEKRRLRVASTAVTGGQTYTFPSGTLQIYFQGAIPTGTAGLDLTSAKSIMNSSMITVAQGSTPGTQSPYQGWNRDSKGDWYIAAGGPVPHSSSAKPKISPYRGRPSDDPSVVLSFLVYDWLRNAYLRPNVDAVVNALSERFANAAGAKQASAGFLIPPAYADDNDLDGIATSLMGIPGNPLEDPRRLDGNELWRQNMSNWEEGSVILASMPSSATTLFYHTGSGDVTGLSGVDPSQLDEFRNALADGNDVAVQTLEMARRVALVNYRYMMEQHDKLQTLTEPAARRPVEARRNHALLVLLRAFVVQGNASAFNTFLATAVTTNWQTVSALFDSKISASAYKMRGGGIVCPPTNPIDQASLQTAFGPWALNPSAMDAVAPEVIQGVTMGRVHTGQAPMVPSERADWFVPPIKNPDAPDGPPIVQAMIVVGSLAATSSNIPQEDHLFSPVLAATLVPTSQDLIYAYSIIGDAAQGDEGKVAFFKPKVSIGGRNTLTGQYLYQNPESLITRTPGSIVMVMYNCVAIDNGATHSGGYFASKKEPGSNIIPATSGNPPLICEWALRCPIPVCKSSQNRIIRVSVQATNANGSIGNVYIHKKENGDYAPYWVEPGTNPDSIVPGQPPPPPAQPMHTLDLASADQKTSDAAKKDFKMVISEGASIFYNPVAALAFGGNEFKQVGDKQSLGDQNIDDLVDKLKPLAPPTSESSAAGNPTFQSLLGNGEAIAESAKWFKEEAGNTQDKLAQKILEENSGNELDLVRMYTYSQGHFYIYDQDNCPKFYRWSS